MYLNPDDDPEDFFELVESASSTRRRNTAKRTTTTATVTSRRSSRMESPIATTIRKSHSAAAAASSAKIMDLALNIASGDDEPSNGSSSSKSRRRNTFQSNLFSARMEQELAALVDFTKSGTATIATARATAHSSTAPEDAKTETKTRMDRRVNNIGQRAVGKEFVSKNNNKKSIKTTTEELKLTTTKTDAEMMDDGGSSSRSRRRNNFQSNLFSSRMEEELAALVDFTSTGTTLIATMRAIAHPTTVPEAAKTKTKRDRRINNIGQRAVGKGFGSNSSSSKNAETTIEELKLTTKIDTAADKEDVVVNKIDTAADEEDVVVNNASLILEQESSTITGNTEPMGVVVELEDTDTDQKHDDTNDDPIMEVNTKTTIEELKLTTKIDTAADKDDMVVNKIDTAADEEDAVVNNANLILEQESSTITGNTEPMGVVVELEDTDTDQKHEDTGDDPIMEVVESDLVKTSSSDLNSPSAVIDAIRKRRGLRQQRQVDDDDTVVDAPLDEVGTKEEEVTVVKEPTVAAVEDAKYDGVADASMSAAAVESSLSPPKEEEEESVVAPLTTAVVDSVVEGGVDDATVPEIETNMKIKMAQKSDDKPSMTATTMVLLLAPPTEAEEKEAVVVAVVEEDEEAVVEPLTTEVVESVVEIPNGDFEEEAAVPEIETGLKMETPQKNDGMPSMTTMDTTEEIPTSSTMESPRAPPTEEEEKEAVAVTIVEDEETFVDPLSTEVVESVVEIPKGDFEAEAAVPEIETGLKTEMPKKDDGMPSMTTLDTAEEIPTISTIESQFSPPKEEEEEADVVAVVEDDVMLEAPTIAEAARETVSTNEIPFVAKAEEAAVVATVEDVVVVEAVRESETATPTEVKPSLSKKTEVPPKLELPKLKKIMKVDVKKQDVEKTLEVAKTGAAALASFVSLVTKGSAELVTETVQHLNTTKVDDTDMTYEEALTKVARGAQGFWKICSLIGGVAKNSASLIAAEMKDSFQTKIEKLKAAKVARLNMEKTASSSFHNNNHYRSFSLSSTSVVPDENPEPTITVPAEEQPAVLTTREDKLIKSKPVGWMWDDVYSAAAKVSAPNSSATAKLSEETKAFSSSPSSSSVKKAAKVFYTLFESIDMLQETVLSLKNDHLKLKSGTTTSSEEVDLPLSKTTSTSPSKSSKISNLPYFLEVVEDNTETDN